MSENVQNELSAIVKLVEELPERYRERAFELLLSDLLANKRQSKTPAPPAGSEEKKDSGWTPTLPPAIRAFMQRYAIGEDQLRKLVLMEGREVHFIREPSEVGKAAGQIQWALLLAMKSALLGQDFMVDPEDVRSVCIAKDLYDRANFASTFKRNKDVFNKAPEPQGEPVRLSTKGEAELGNLIKALVE